jgi:hypothetical protein
MFNLVKILTLSLCLFSCLPQGPEGKEAFLFDDSTGLIVYNYSNSDIDIEQIKKTIECVADFMGADKSLISLLSVTITDDEMVYCYDAKRHVACFHRYNASIAIGGNHREEMLQHELKHFFLEILTGDANASHSNRVFKETFSCNYQ